MQRAVHMLRTCINKLLAHGPNFETDRDHVKIKGPIK